MNDRSLKSEEFNACFNLSRHNRFHPTLAYKTLVIFGLIPILDAVGKRNHIKEKRIAVTKETRLTYSKPWRHMCLPTYFGNNQKTDWKNKISFSQRTKRTVVYKGSLSFCGWGWNPDSSEFLALRWKTWNQVLVTWCSITSSLGKIRCLGFELSSLTSFLQSCPLFTSIVYTCDTASLPWLRIKYVSDVLRKDLCFQYWIFL